MSKFETWGLGVLVLAAAAACGDGWSLAQVLGPSQDRADRLAAGHHPQWMSEDLRSTLDEMYDVLGIAQGDDPSAGLAALETLDKLAMRARRQIENPKVPDASGSDAIKPIAVRGEVWSADGLWIYARAEGGGEWLAMSSDDAWVALRNDGGRGFKTDPLEAAFEPSPLAKAQNELTHAVIASCLASNPDAARRMLDRVVESVIAVRGRFWEEKSRR